MARLITAKRFPADVQRRALKAWTTGARNAEVMRILGVRTYWQLRWAMEALDWPKRTPAHLRASLSGPKAPRLPMIRLGGRKGAPRVNDRDQVITPFLLTATGYGSRPCVACQSTNVAPTGLCLGCAVDNGRRSRG